MSTELPPPPLGSYNERQREPKKRAALLSFARSCLFGCFGVVVTAKDNAQRRILHALDYVVVVGQAPEDHRDEAEHLSQDKLEKVSEQEPPRSTQTGRD